MRSEWFLTPFFLLPWCDLLLGKIRLVISVKPAVCRSGLTWLGVVRCGQAVGISNAGCDGGAGARSVSPTANSNFKANLQARYWADGWLSSVSVEIARKPDRRAGGSSAAWRVSFSVVRIAWRSSAWGRFPLNQINKPQP